MLHVLLTWMTQELWSETLQTLYPNTISQSLVGFPKQFSLEMILPWLSEGRGSGLRETLCGDDEHFF